MKKNKSMRLAGGLMIATMLSTSIVSGTYAKYVTSDSASDSARVAKFGVVVQADGTLFGKNYLATADNTPTDATEGITVKSLSNPQDNVVAPGTKNDTGLAFSVTGTPEVSVNVNFDITAESDVWLGKGTYPDMTNGDVFDGKVDTSDTFETTEYYPIKYTLTKNGTAVPGVETLDQVKTYLTGLNGDYEPGTDLSDLIGNLVLTWEWDFDASGAGTYDKQDTLLGDLAAGEGVAEAIAALEELNVTVDTPASSDSLTAEDGNYNLNTELGFTITVTQID